MQQTNLGARQVYYWAPAATLQPAPLLIFSHGFAACGDQIRFLFEALAAHGYWVFAPNHADARCPDPNTPRGQPVTSFYRPFLWTDQTYANRRDDITAVLAALKTAPRFKNKIDFNRLGLLGHSLGGYTALGLAGGWDSWHLAGVKAVLAMSPYALPFWILGRLSHINAPVMYQTGTRDAYISPYINWFGGVYTFSPAPKYDVELTGADHYAWANDGSIQRDLTVQQQQAQQTAIINYSLAFLDYYVKGEQPSHLLTQLAAGVTSLHFAVELGEGNLHNP